MFYNLLVKDKKSRENYGKKFNEFYITKWKYLQNNYLSNDMERILFFIKFYKKKVFYYSLIKNRCIISARGRFVLAKGHNLTRMQFKKLVSNGFLTGWSKSSW